jgi:acetylornithine deacetylase/succinyl-diaminopimelate desuccinylase-like protein
MTGMHITVFGAKQPLHSGNYGNFAPNPALKLARLLASMKDESGRVLIKGFYDDVAPLSAQEKAALKAVPDPTEKLKQNFGLAAGEMKNVSFLEGITTLPTLNINGFVSANVGRLASNVIPSTATASLDLRLVKGNDVKRQVAKVIQHIEKQGFIVLDREPTDAERLKFANIATIKVTAGYNPQRTPMNLPLAQSVIRAVQATAKEPLILLPSAGGSLPLCVFESVLNTPPLTVPIVNFDNNQHAENENLKLNCLWEGMDTFAAIMLLLQ